VGRAYAEERGDRDGRSQPSRGYSPVDRWSAVSLDGPYGRTENAVPAADGIAVVKPYACPLITRLAPAMGFGAGEHVLAQGDGRLRRTAMELGHNGGK
jgi:hypothetical protein